jgi:hypothetical protein
LQLAILDYDYFKEYCMTSMVTILGGPDKYSAELTTIAVADDEHIDSIMVRKAGSTEGWQISFRPRPFYQDYCNGLSLGEVMLEILKVVDRPLKFDWDFNPNDIVIFHAVEKRLILRPLNYYRSKKLLQEHVYLKVDDIALVLYVLVNDGNGERHTAKIPRKVFTDWGLPEDFVIQLAMENTVRLYPPMLMPMEATLTTSMQGDTSFSFFLANNKFFMDPLLAYKLKPSMAHIYTLCVHKGINGAMAPFYPGVLDRLCDLLQDDLYICFTSARECAVHPASTISLSEIKNLAREMYQNPQLLADSIDKLTPNAYVYYRKERIFMKA